MTTYRPRFKFLLLLVFVLALPAHALAQESDVDLRVSSQSNSSATEIIGSGTSDHYFWVHNDGAVPATNIVATLGFSVNPLPLIGGTCTRTTSQGNVPSGATSWDWDVGTVNPGLSAWVREVCTPSSASPETNREVSLTIKSADQPDPGPGVNTSAEDTDWVRESDLSITKSDLGNDPVVAGTILTYQIYVTNNGPSDAADVVITDTLPAGTTLSSSIGCNEDPSGGDPTCTLGTVAAGAPPVGVQIWVEVANTVADGDTLINTASVVSASPEPDPDPNSNTAIENTQVIREAYWTVEKVWDGGSVPVAFECTDTYTDSGNTPDTFDHAGFANGVGCTVTETVPLGYAPTYSEDCDVSPIVSGELYECVIGNATSEARIHVTKWFSDNNESEVTATVLCNDGFISQDGVAQVEPGPIGHTFIITDFIDGALDCTVTESGGPDGYTTMPLLGFEFLGMDSETGFYQANFTNRANDAEYAVTKEWMITNDGGNVVREDVYVTIECTSPIDQPDGKAKPCLNGCGSYNYKSAWLGDGDTLTASVSTLTGPAMCKAYEDEVQSGVDVENGCENYETLTAGEKYGCTIYNSVFFEGIPTLSQYGLALMALLMLGVGFIGFRRFI